jgi:hypothetical protein
MRTRLLALLALSGAVIAGVVAVLWSAGSSTAQREPFSTVAVTPAEIDLYLALNTEPASEQWIAFADLLDAINVQDPFRDAWTDALADEDIDWDKDIVALLGDEAYVAVTDFTLVDDFEGVVAVFEIRDRERAESFFVEKVDDAIDDSEDAREETTYEGVTIHLLPFESDDFSFDNEYDYDSGFGEDFTERDEEREFAAAAFTENFAIFGLHQNDVKGVIDVMQGRAPNASTNARFMEQRAKRLDDFLIWGYVDMAPAWDALEKYIEEETDSDEDDLRQLQRVVDESRDSTDRITLSISATSDGLLVDATVLRAEGAAPGDTYLSKPFETKFADAVPADALLFASGYDLYNQIYVPLYDSFADIDLNFADPYCSNTGSFGTSFAGGFGASSEDDPVYGQFYDAETGSFDYDAYDVWQTEQQERFTRPDGFPDYDAYYEHIDSLYKDACEERSQTIAEAIEEFEGDVGFDLEDDFLGLMTGEIALALEASDFDADEPSFAVAGLAEVTDDARARRSMELIEEYLIREHDAVSDGVDDRGIHSLTDEESDFGDEAFAWTVNDGRIIAGYPYDYVAAIDAGVEGDTLADTGDWKRTLDLLPGEKTGVLYVNLAKIIEEVRATEDAEDELKDAFDGEITFEDLEPIRSIGIVTQNVEGGVAMRAILFIDE